MTSYFNHLYFIISLRMSDEIQSRIFMANAAARKENCFHQQIGLNLRKKKLVRCYIWSIAFHDCET